MSMCIIQDFTFVGKYNHTMRGYALLHDVAVTKHHVVAFQVRYTREYLHCAAQTLFAMVLRYLCTSEVCWSAVHCFN